MARKIESLKIPGPVGDLEALLEEPEAGETIAAVLVCHPHPQHGGTMHTRVVHRTARGLRKAGAVVLRFNYRGVNLSEGALDYPQATKVIPIGYPTKYPNREYISDITIPKVFIHSTNDEHGPRPDFEAFFATLPEPKEVKWIESKDHFFVDNLEAFEEAVVLTGPL
ncbi:MAG: hypothetical protein NTW74_03930 [Acidobacteria bacterium]|nr:hypothetical protein [Acidobacteriota bacterium]